MTHGPDALTEREKEALRLLLAGHGAKSTAAALGLSVHTVNERLRDARRKLGVSSSREAARLLARAEGGRPDFVGDKEMGVAGGAPAAPEARTDQRGAGRRLAWFAGGMLVMSLFVVAAALLLAHGEGADPARAARRPAATPAASTANEPAALDAARAWVALIDGRRWDESWRAAAAAFRSQLTAAQFGSAVDAARRPLGAVSARTLRSVALTDALPGLPPGRYGVVEFRTSFAGRREAVETVALAREGTDWRAVGYFIR